MDLLDILEGARHVYKPPPPPKPPSSKTSSKQNTKIAEKIASSKDSKTSSKAGKEREASQIIKKPAPVSFEEMMRRASSNLSGVSVSTSSSKSNVPNPVKKPLLPPNVGSSRMPSKSIPSSIISKQMASKSAQKPIPQTSRPSIPAFKSHDFNLGKKPLLPPNVGSSRMPSKSIPSSIISKQMASKSAQKPISQTSRPSKPTSIPAFKSYHPNPVKRALPYSQTPPTNSSLASQTRYPLPLKRFRYEGAYQDNGYDSMDDFIVDGDAEDAEEKELKKVLRSFCRSDKSVWHQREREIDLSKMNARYHDIDAEEKRSKRIARLEDILEEKRGSAALQ